ncbi:MAG: glycosyl transferase family 2, partial [Ferruginibacter sp.]
ASGDDDLFISTAATSTNTKINIDPDTFTLSDPATSWVQWRRQKGRHYSTAKYYKPLHKFLLGFYSLSHFLFYPFFAAAILFFSWKWALVVFGSRLIVQAIVFYPAMKKLNEKDLFPLFLFFDLWMFFYYLIFASTLIKKPGNKWK